MAEQRLILAGKRVTVLVWNSFLYDARVRREAKTLADSGARVTVLCLRTAEELPASEVIDGGIHVERIQREHRVTRMAGRVSRLVAGALETLIGSFAMLFRAIASRPDVIHGNDVNTLVPAWLAAKLARSKLVYDAHEISADREGYRGRVLLVKTVEKWFGNRADARMTTTRMRADWFEQTYGFERVHVVQNRPAYTDVTGDLIRERFGIPHDRLVLLYQGGLQPGRGLRNLIEAVRAVPEAHLVFVGDGRQRAELERIAGDAPDRVHFVGQVALADLPQWTASADVGMQTLRNTCLNHYTTDSNKLFEYVMGGLPVIASDFPEIRAVVETYGLGMLVDPDDVMSLVAAIERFARDSQFREECRLNALRSRSALDWSSQEENFLQAYREALAA